MNTRMKRIYYNCEITNQTTKSRDANFSTTLLTPIVEDPQNYNLSVNRFRIPLNSIPLTLNNIPFNQWQVALSYNGVYKSEFVPQYNQSFKNIYNPVVVTRAGTIETWDSMQTMNVTRTVNLSSGSIVPPGEFRNIFLDYSGNLYYLNASAKSITVYNGNTGALITTLNCQNYALSGETINFINAFGCDPRNGNLYFAYWPGGAVGTVSYRIVELLQQSGSTWSSSNNFYMIDVDPFVYSDFTPSSICVDLKLNYLMVAYTNNTGGLLWGIINGFQLQVASVTQKLIYPTSSWTNDSVSTDTYYNFQLISNETGTYAYAMKGTFATDDNSILAITYPPGSNTLKFIGKSPMTLDRSYGLLGFDDENNLLIGNVADYKAFNLTNGTISYLFLPDISVNYPLVISTGHIKTGNEIVEAGDYPLYYYQDFLTQINNAFQFAFDKLAGLPIVVQSPPLVMFDGTTKLFYISCENGYTSPDITIEMNSTLFNMFKFPSVPTLSEDPNYAGFRSIFTINTSDTGTAFKIYQEASSISAFWDLARILLVTSKIPVRGDIEGINSSVNIVTDVVPDTTVLTPNDILVYQPTVLRWYNLDSNIPLRDINIQFYYGNKDGTIYPMVLFSNEYASIKLEFAQVT
ncbi:MAG: hypothetical protein JSS98_06130 [Bacteroidetes bacterium]|nr:hypothetical protein [Bacteroidota bacterium]